MRGVEEDNVIDALDTHGIYKRLRAVRKMLSLLYKALIYKNYMLWQVLTPASRFPTIPDGTQSNALYQSLALRGHMHMQ